MRAATLRRTLVFAVCALGVGCLYLAPSLTRSDEPVGGGRADDQPRTRPSSGGVQPVQAQSASAGQAAEGTGAEAARTSTPRTATGQDVDVSSDRPSGASTRAAGRGATAYDPARTPDREPPTDVPAITPSRVTVDRLTLSWPPARDNVGVIGYRVWLNGFQVASTVQTTATVRWFNDGQVQHVVQVRALDAAGNESEASPSVLIARPTPAPEATDAPTSAPTGGDPSATATPTPSPTGAASGPAATPEAVASTATAGGSDGPS